MWYLQFGSHSPPGFSACPITKTDLPPRLFTMIGSKKKEDSCDDFEPPFQDLSVWCESNEE